MNLLRTFLLTCWAVLALAPAAPAQLACPPNIDFEAGNLQGWKAYTSVNQGTGYYVWNTVAPIPNRHGVFSGTGIDPYGGFPIVAPSGGAFSLKLGNANTGKEMERVSYTFKIPSGQNEYAVIYRYAIVLQDPNHTPVEQPFFKVSAFDSVTGATINCGNFNYVSSSSLPGFVYGSSFGGYYKNWATASLNLSGQAGRTVRLEFTTADCSQSGHFGYAYVDMNCGLFAIQNTACNNSATAPLSAPPGFQNYTWYDSSFSTVVGTGANISVPNPSRRTVYRVKLEPYPGYGCMDTLSAAIVPAYLNASAGPDTALCNQPSYQLNATVTGSAPPFSYAWTSSSGYNCNNCRTPTVTPTTATDYYLTVTDANNCVARDTLTVTPTVGLTANVTPVSCFGGTDGSILANVQNGTPPFTYQWGNGQTTASASNLPAGTHTLRITDGKGCVSQPTVVVPQPAAPISAAVRVAHNNPCSGNATGSATVTASGGTAPYTYNWNTTPAQTTATATNLASGSHTVTVTDAKGCTTTASVVISSPQVLHATLLTDSIPCYGAATGSLRLSPVTGGTAPYQYRWLDGSGSTATVRQGLRAGTYTIRVTDAAGCILELTQVLPERPQINLNAGADTFICGGNSVALQATGTAVVWQWLPATGLSCLTCPNPVASPAQTTTYLLQAADRYGCPASDAITITVQPRMPVTVGKEERICFGESVTLAASGGDRYQWTPAGSIQNPQTASPTATPATETNYKVIIYQGDCFTDTLYQKILVAPLPQIQAGKDVLLFSGAQMTLMATGSENIQSVAWTPSVGLNCYNCLMPTIVDARSVTYTVTATAEYGCEATDTVRVQVACDGSPFYVANTFTPNGDGLDDRFYPQGTGIVRINRMQIQSKWGEVVFERSSFPSNDPSYGWDGTFGGKPMDSGTFLYVIEAICDSGAPLLLKGDVNLMR